MERVRLDRVLYSPLHYPADYGFIPRTLAEDGDHLDVLIVTYEPTFPGCVVPVRPVGVLDMLRFQEFTAGQFWRDEFGNIEKESEFISLLAYSPYHNVKEGVEYPPTLIMTADTDDRVVPMHSFKFAAALQRAQAGDAPILLRIETRAGHGGGTPVKKSIEIATDRYAFLVKTLGMDAAKD